MARRLAASIAVGVLLVTGVASAVPATAAPAATVSCASGQTGLIAAVNAANSAGGGTISLASGCTYNLTAPDNSENGLPVITTRVSVNGNGATVDGNGAVRIFEVDEGGNLSVQNATLTHGSAGDFGGAIVNMSGTVTSTTRR